MRISFFSSEEAVKTKWKNLRDTFRKELKKISDSPENCKTEEECELMACRYAGTWPHFYMMRFLLTVVSFKSGDDNLPSAESPVLPIDYVNPKIEIEEELPYEEEMVVESGASMGTTYEGESTLQKKFKSPSSNLQIQRLERRIASLEETQEDEDLNFFKSLVPHVKRLPTVNKLRFRSKVEELLANEIMMLKDSKSHSSLWVGNGSYPLL